MNPVYQADILLLMILSIFLLGAATFISGMIILISRSMGKDMRAITSSTRKIAQKALAHDIAGLVGNASMLLSAANDMMRTSSGIGAFLMITGGVMMLIAIALFIYFYRGTQLYGLSPIVP